MSSIQGPKIQKETLKFQIQALPFPDIQLMQGQ